MKTAIPFTIWVLAFMPQPGFPFAIGVREDLIREGVELRTDSFVSSDPNYSQYGLYDATKRAHGGDILCGGRFTNLLNQGNAMITGKLFVGSGDSPDIGPAGSIGDVLWVWSETGIQPGWVLSAHTDFPSVALPATVWELPIGPGRGDSAWVVVEGVDRWFSHVFTVSGNYWIPANGSIYVGTNVAVRLRVTTDEFSPAAIYVAGAGHEAGRLVAYLASPVVELGAEHRSQSGVPSSLVLYGLPACSQITYRGNGNFAGVIYAPDADMTMLATGNNSFDVSGSVVAKSLRLQGKYHFHADEALPTAIWIVDSPEDRFDVAGGSPTFSVLASGRNLMCQWQFNEQEITGATNFSLTLSNVGFVDAGSYRAILDNSYVTVTSTPAMLQVYASAQPTVTSSRFPESNLFRLSVSGVPGFSYRVEASSNLTEWFPMWTNAAPFEMSDPVNADCSRRFYRAVYAP